MNRSKNRFLPFPFNKNANKAPKYSPSPSPEEVLKSRPPKKGYEGLKVAWTLIVRDMHAGLNRNDIVVLASFEDKPGDIWLTVDTDRFPNILYCPAGSQIKVKGEITAVKGEDIYLGNCQL